MTLNEHGNLGVYLHLHYVANAFIEVPFNWRIISILKCGLSFIKLTLLLPHCLLIKWPCNRLM